MTTWKSVKEQILSNPEVKKHYDDLTPEFDEALDIVTGIAIQ